MSEETKYIRQQEAAAMKKKLDELLAAEGNEEERTEMKKILGNDCLDLFHVLSSLSSHSNTHIFYCDFYFSKVWNLRRRRV